MKINDTIKKAGSPGLTSTQTKAGTGAEKAGATKPASDNVTLSPGVKALAGSSATTGVFDANKVEQIKAAIAGGKFQVDAEKVANGLLDTVNQLIQSRKA